MLQSSEPRVLAFLFFLLDVKKKQQPCLMLHRTLIHFNHRYLGASFSLACYLNAGLATFYILNRYLIALVSSKWLGFSSFKKLHTKSFINKLHRPHNLINIVCQSTTQSTTALQGHTRFTGVTRSLPGSLLCGCQVSNNVLLTQPSPC